MRNHTDLLNYLAETFNLQSYLEIGVQNPANNFDKIKCDQKTGVDPEISNKFIQNFDCSITYSLIKDASDEYFKWNKSHTYDLIFIDGLHHADQVKRDFENSLKCLADRGFIVIHDTLPDAEEFTQVPRTTKKWFGDVWKFAMNLICYPVDFFTLDIDCGCTVVCKSKDTAMASRYYDWNWSSYQRYKNEQLNIITAKEFIEYVEHEMKFRQSILTLSEHGFKGTA